MALVIIKKTVTVSGFSQQLSLFQGRKNLQVIGTGEKFSDYGSVYSENFYRYKCQFALRSTAALVIGCPIAALGFGPIIAIFFLAFSTV